MNARHFETLLPAVVGTLLFSCEPAGFSGELPQGRFQILRVFYDRTITVGVKFLNADINADAPAAFCYPDGFKIYVQNDKILARRCLLNRYVVDMPDIHRLFNL